MADWIVAACAVLSLVGAGLSWWRSNASRKAREDARTAAEHAQSTLTEIRKQSTAMEAIAAAVQPDSLVWEHDAGMLWRLRNTTAAEIAIERVKNATEFAGKPFRLLPTVIPPGGAVSVTLFSAYEIALPATLELEIRGRTDVLRLPVPGVR